MQKGIVDVRMGGEASIGEREAVVCTFLSERGEAVFQSGRQISNSPAVLQPRPTGGQKRLVQAPGQEASER